MPKNRIWITIGQCIGLGGLLMMAGVPLGMAQTFVDVGASVGVVATHVGLPDDEYIDAGAVWFDYDNDGDLDLYMTQRVGANFLFENQLAETGTASFIEVAAARGAADALHDGSGATAADYDNDGDLDLLIGNADEDVLLRNELIETGTATFTDVTAGSGLNQSKSRASTPSWGDYDGDGYLDLFIVYHQAVVGSGGTRQDRFYHNNGDGTFTEVSALLAGDSDAGDGNFGDGIDDMTGKGFLAGWTDFDNDGDLDIFLQNDCPFFEEGQKLWRNDGGTDPLAWNFTEVSHEMGLPDEVGGLCVNSMGLAMGDYNRDGLWDYFYTDIESATLIRNEGGGLFTDVTVEAGVFEDTVPGTDPPLNRVTWGAVFIDYDLDGFQDIAVAAGALLPDTEANPQPNLFYENNGDGTFTDLSTTVWPVDIGRGRIVLMGDYDQDGDPDIFLVNYDDPAVLLENTTPAGNHWLQVVVKGAGPPLSNRDGIGAKLHVTDANGVTQHYEIRSGSNLGGGDDLAAYFGFGDLSGAPDQLVDIEIEWPSGLVQTLADVDLTDTGGTGKRLTIAEPSFADHTGDIDVLLTHDGQTSITNGDMAIGTGAAWLDCDADGDLDLYVTMRSSPNRLFQNDGTGAFTNIASGATRDAAHDGAGVAAADFDNDGDTDLYLANSDGDVLLQNNGTCGFTNVTATAFADDLDAGELIPARGTSASWGDYNNDGFLDLYVANHLHMDATGAEDFAADSQDRLFLNDGDGTFTNVSDLIRGLDDGDGNDDLDGYGFLAGWTDFDNDGDLDIFLQNDCLLEIKGNKLWRNDGGVDPLAWTFTEVSASLGADQCQNAMGLGWGDYDRDGLYDYLFSNISSATLLQGTGGAAFVDATAAAGVEDDFVPGSDPLEARKTWAPLFMDFDLDGWQDLFLAAGAISEPSATEPQPNLLYRNLGDGTFADWSEGSGVATTQRTRTAVMGDYDGDGAPDLFFVNFGEDAMLARNIVAEVLGHHWLQIDLDGGGAPLTNADGVGAKIQVTTPDGVAQTWEMRSGSGLGGGDDVAAYFGLGDQTTADIEIEWPSNITQTLDAVAADQRLTVAEAGMQVLITPDVWPVTFDEDGGTFDYTIELGNHTDADVTVDVWTHLSGPGGVSIIRGPVTRTLIPEERLDAVVTQGVPAAAAVGTYTVTLTQGVFPIPSSTASFVFDKTASGGAGAGRGAWASNFVAVMGADDPGDPTGGAPPTEASVYPNPFNPRATFTLSVPRAQAVRIVLYDVLGREVMRLHDGPMAAAVSQSFTIDGSRLPSGVYLLQVRGEDFAQTQTVTLLK